MMVERDNEAVNKEKAVQSDKRKERGNAASFNLDYFHKQTMLKKMEREAENRRYSLTRGGDVRPSPLESESDSKKQMKFASPMSNQE